MILLDTNVISELMRPSPSPAVVAWVDRQPRETLCTASIVQTEILYGIACLPQGRRKADLAAAAAAMFAEDFGDRVLPYDSLAAPYYADIVTARRAAGRPIEAFDALIAATARAWNVTVATRDTEGFTGLGLELVNPWEEGTPGRSSP